MIYVDFLIHQTNDTYFCDILLLSLILKNCYSSDIVMLLKDKKITIEKYTFEVITFV